MFAASDKYVIHFNFFLVIINTFFKKILNFVRVIIALRSSVTFCAIFFAHQGNN